MKILFVNASPHGETSHGYGLAVEMIRSLGKTAHSRLVTRDLVSQPLPPVTQDYAKAITSREPDVSRFDVSEQLIREIEMTDALIINTPMHNFTVPAALKLWIDYVLRVHRTFAVTPKGKVGLMRDRPTFVIVSSGGFHSGERAWQGDFLTPYLRYALGSIGLKSTHFVLLQGLTHGNEAVADALQRAHEEIARHPLFASVNSIIS
ncbi:NAD(P)H-dependent oxidoreductase [Paraburkholderia sp. LEh10]|jgi:FMN-dependent NADH-azoreductase|uniref:FMN-dependent NADH-azoreductase n=1 Tax=Paraburkholderia sp. LEh10 TaxID=2821353 RepID=UPI001AE7F0A5|nr:NAD(P)H-dependent oxidoreductase [Paraburkholderia sp. LEh10]MBP0595820.1 NAD(P)H-dependent oxidoreductase [Paraburkholderia sp. LEh10]